MLFTVEDARENKFMLGSMEYLNIHGFDGVHDSKYGSAIEFRILTLELNGTFCWELVPYNFSLVVLHTITVVFFPLVTVHAWRYG